MPGTTNNAYLDDSDIRGRSSGLYSRLLGDSWRDLDKALRCLHGAGANVHAEGVFRVRQGSNRVARVIARWSRMPAAGDAVDIRLKVTADEKGEEWRRTFAGHPLVSLQLYRDDGLLVERMGMVELRFRLTVAGGSLNYQTESAALSLGSLSLPLPNWLSPRVIARERAVGDLNQVHVSVDVSFPLLGRLIAYDGMLTRIEAHR